MPGYLVQVGAKLLCPHGGQVQITSINVRVKAGGQAVATVNDLYMVSGCPLQPPPAGPSPPCQKVQWMMGALRVKIGGQPALLQSAVGLCIPSIPPGPPQVVMTQLRVKGM